MSRVDNLKQHVCEFLVRIQAVHGLGAPLHCGKEYELYHYEADKSEGQEGGAAAGNK